MWFTGDLLLDQGGRINNARSKWSSPLPSQEFLAQIGLDQLRKPAIRFVPVVLILIEPFLRMPPPRK
jgi:hypothetical protein